ncbi:MAG: hypothetical protein ACLFT2_01025 [Candidatus Brocadiia bacterium]
MLACMALAVILPACGVTDGQGDSGVQYPGQPELSLASSTRVRRMWPGEQNHREGMVEARNNDLLLENAFVSFVIGSANRRYPAPFSAGAVLDARLQGDEGALGAFVPDPGGKEGWGAVCRSVQVTQWGGEERAAAVRVKGRLVGSRGGEYVTEYVLRPGRKWLEVTTTVENNSDGSTVTTRTEDVLFPGDMERFAEGIGLHPDGKKGESRWMGLLRNRTALMVEPTEESGVRGVHAGGHSRLQWPRTTISAGEKFTYRRRVRVGGTALPLRPADGTRSASGTDKDDSDDAEEAEETEETEGDQERDRATEKWSKVDVEIVDQSTGAGIRDACVEFIDRQSGPAGVAQTDTRGRARLNVPPGKYEVVCHAAGRAPSRVRQKIASGRRYEYEFGMKPGVRVNVRVKELVNGETLPAGARITLRHTGSDGASFYDVPDTSNLTPGRVFLVPESGELTVPLPDAGGDWIMVASKGPLYSMAARQLEALQTSKDMEVEFVLRRVINSERHVTCDFVQHTNIGPGASVSPANRRLMNQCEGVDLGVVASSGALRNPAGRDIKNGLLPALLVSTPVTGELLLVGDMPDSGRAPRDRDLLLPPWKGKVKGTAADESGDVPGPLWVVGMQTAEGKASGRSPIPGEWGEDAGEVFDSARGALDGAMIALKDPLRSERGYFERLPLLPHARRPAGYSGNYDALLVGPGEVREVLPYWFTILNRGEKIRLVAGSDSRHSKDARLMAARTYLLDKTNTDSPITMVRDYRDEDVAGPVFVSTGPFLKVDVNGKPPGSEIAPVDGEAKVAVEVRAPRWMDVDTVTVYKNGREYASPEIERRGELVYEEDLWVNCEAGDWIAVSASGSQDMGPIYVDRNGEGVRPFAITNPVWIEE